MRAVGVYTLVTPLKIDHCLTYSDIKNGKGPIENLHIADVPKPKLGKEQALVKIKAFGLNRMDLLQREGQYPVPPGASKILGVEFSGSILLPATCSFRTKPLQKAS